MFEYFISENMKIKRKLVQKLVWMAPMMIILFSGFILPTYFQVNIYNWWYCLILQGFIALEGCFLYKIDGDMKNKAVLALPINLKKVWIAKVLVGLKNLVNACSIIFIAGELSVFIIPIKSVSHISILSGFIGTIVIILTSMWQIPLCYFLGRKIGISATVILTLAVTMFSTIIAPYKFWIFDPFSYTSRLMCPILKLLPNGLLAHEGSKTFTKEILNVSSIPIGVSVSIILFIGITYLTAKWYEKCEVK